MTRVPLHFSPRNTYGRQFAGRHTSDFMLPRTLYYPTLINTATTTSSPLTGAAGAAVMSFGSVPSSRNLRRRSPPARLRPLGGSQLSELAPPLCVPLRPLWFNPFVR